MYITGILPSEYVKNHDLNKCVCPDFKNKYPYSHMMLCTTYTTNSDISYYTINWVTGGLMTGALLLTGLFFCLHLNYIANNVSLN